MRVVEVIPVVKGIAKTTLTYFSKEPLEAGRLVRVPVRNGTALAVVSAAKDARTARTELRRSGFPLRKVLRTHERSMVSESFMAAVRETARFYAASPGSVLNLFVPKIFMENPDLLDRPKRQKRHPRREVRLIQLPDSERYREYRSIVRECFARGSSVMLIAPTAEEVEKAVEGLSVGIEQFVFTPLAKSAKKQKASLMAAKSEKHPVLFISTPAYAAFDRPDLDAIILERENSGWYRPSRPHIGVRRFLENYCRESGKSLIMGDSVLSLESLYLERESRYAEFSPLTWRLKYEAETEVVNMRADKEFKIISSRLEEAMRQTLERRKNIFLFGARKGLAPTTICGDCGSILLCRNCASPLILYDGRPPLYICRHCGAKRSSETKCDTCGSWKLTPLGIGTERIAEECRRLFPETSVLSVDRDSTPNRSGAGRVLERFERGEGIILVGTEMALARVGGVPLVAAVSLDPLFSIPDFHVNERIFYLVDRLRAASSERFLLQSRNTGEKVLEYAAAGNVLDFYREEIREREELMYPPFSIFVKVATEGRPEEIRERFARLKSEFGDFEPHFIRNRLGGSSREGLSAVMRFPAKEWPNDGVVKRLLLLGYDFSIKVEPESLL